MIHSEFFGLGGLVKRFVVQVLEQVLEVRPTPIFTVLAIWVVLVMWNQHVENDRPVKHDREI